MNLKLLSHTTGISLHQSLQGSQHASDALDARL